jgi:hypothetical protein
MLLGTCPLHAGVGLNLWAAALLLSIAVSPAFAAPKTKKHVSAAPHLPSMPAPVNHVQSTTSSSPATTAPEKTGENFNWAAPPPKLPTTMIYDGQAAAKSGLSIVAWGGGSGGVSTDMSYGRGGHAIKVVTHSLYEGAKINFDPGVSLGDMRSAKNPTFQLLIRFGQASDMDDEDTGKADMPLTPSPRTYAVDGTRGVLSNGVFTVDSAHPGYLRLAQVPGYPGAGYPGYPGAGTNRGYPGAGYPGQRYPGAGYPGQQYPGARYPRGRYPGGANRQRPPQPNNSPTTAPNYPGAPGYPAYPGNRRTYAPSTDTETAWNPPVHYLRLLFTLQNGAQAEVVRPTPWPTAFDDPDTAWLSLSVPLSILKFPDGQSNSPLASITIGGDGPSTFYIGQMNLVDDTAPIICSAGTTQDVAAGDTVNFQARAQGGVSMLTYSWDFDSSDGISEDADGATASHTYTKGDKDYTVTLTVSDLDGIKKPCTSTVKVKVEE